MPRQLKRGDLAGLVRRGETVFVGGATGEPSAILSAWREERALADVTLVAVPIVVAVMQLGWIAHVAFAIAAFVVGIYLCGESARRLGVHDHPGIVWDEITGYTVTMLAAPATGWWLLGGFVLFRFFDIVKPWPIREADHSLPGGLGIMLDDVMAGIFAAAILLAIKSLI